MQEQKMKGNRKSLTETLKKRDASAWPRRLFAVLQKLIGFASGLLFGYASLPFGTRPLGLALFAATEVEIFSVFAGLLVSTTFAEGSFVPYLCLYVFAALLRFAFFFLFSEGGGKGSAQRGKIASVPPLFSLLPKRQRHFV